MKKTLLLSVMLFLTCGFANAATPWWEQPTICRIDTTRCYVSMGAGYDSEIWDANANCRGMKYICAEAFTESKNEPTLVPKNDITSGKDLNSQDFDFTKLNGNCFGVRKTDANGSTAHVNGNNVNVWCTGILDNVDETVPTGEITYGAQPTCQSLWDSGYIGVLNGRCYGKYYDPSKYYVKCGGDLLPTQIVILNGADDSGLSGTLPSDEQDRAAKFFQSMVSAAAAARKSE